MKRLIAYILGITLFLAPRPSLGQTYIISVDDLLMEIPYFTNAPEYNFNNGMQGNLPIGTHTKQPRKKVSEQEILDLAWTLFPTADHIRVWNNKLIIKLKD